MNHMDKKQTKAAFNPAHFALFGAACVAASAMGTACEKLARAVLGTGRGRQAYDNARKAITAMESASKDGNAHTVRRYTSEALAILAQGGRKVDVPTVAAERTEKAQGARKSLGVAPRGVKKKKTGKREKKVIVQNFEQSYRAMLKLQAGRSNLIAWAKAEGYDLTFSLRSERGIVSAPSVAKPAKSKGKGAELRA